MCFLLTLASDWLNTVKAEFASPGVVYLSCITPQMMSLMLGPPKEYKSNKLQPWQNLRMPCKEMPNLISPGFWVNSMCLLTKKLRLGQGQSASSHYVVSNFLLKIYY